MLSPPLNATAVDTIGHDREGDSPTVTRTGATFNPACAPTVVASATATRPPGTDRSGVVRRAADGQPRAIADLFGIVVPAVGAIPD